MVVDHFGERGSQLAQLAREVGMVALDRVERAARHIAQLGWQQQAEHRVACERVSEDELPIVGGVGGDQLLIDAQSQGSDRRVARQFGDHPQQAGVDPWPEDRTRAPERIDRRR